MGLEIIKAALALEGTLSAPHALQLIAAVESLTAEKEAAEREVVRLTKENVGVVAGRKTLAGATYATMSRMLATAESSLAQAREEVERLKSKSEERRNMLEDVVNELDLSDGMIEQHGPTGTAPAILVGLVLARKDQEIAMLKAGMKPIEAAEQREKGLREDTHRYKRLRILGCAPFDSVNLDQGTVLRFTNLDQWVDEDLARVPDRGEHDIQNTPAPSFKPNAVNEASGLKGLAALAAASKEEANGKS